ncbi:MAG TPA: protein jag [Dialister sp.]|nr:protein jag [Dialister sp.]
MRTVRITAKTIEAAVAEGLEKLGISREEAVVHVVEQPSSGLFGLIHKKMAVVDISAPDEEVPEETPVDAPEEAKAEEPAEEVKEETPVEAVKAEEKPAEETPAEEKAEAPAEEKKAEREEPAFDPEEQKKVAEEAKTFLTGVFAGMHLAVTMECRMTEERIMINLVGDGLGILIGKHGQTLDALQYLTNLAAGKSFRHHYFILLDVENYRERRQDTLEALARRLAGKVKRTGEEVRLEPMAAGERRIIHLALQDDHAVSTDSEGEAPYRYVVIRPKD